jgi:Protein of unknown function (DUF1302)
MRMRNLAAALLLIALGLPGGTARAFEAFDGRLQVHGFGEVQLRAISSNYKASDWYASQWANVLDLEVEGDLLPQGWGPISLLQAFARLEVRYDCIYTGCGVAPTYHYFGNRSDQGPRQLAGAVSNPYSGILAIKPVETIQEDNELVSIFAVPPLKQLADLGSKNIDNLPDCILGSAFTVKSIDGTLGNTAFPIGPWRPDRCIQPVASMSQSENTTLGLPLRPRVPNQKVPGLANQGIFDPSLPFLQQLPKYGDFDQNFTQSELAWNHGASQDEKELKEAYLDLETLDGRLWIRAGKQDIVWGKTELFRTTDQFNPLDLAVSTLPTLEESRIPLWSVRGVYSLYDLGPLEDVRLELAMNYDQFEPLDLGQCGEPYTVWLVCAKTFGLWGHGFTGNGIAGEIRPPDPWDSTSGIEVGGRAEFRWSRFSFQLSDFWGYDDAPTIDYFYEYSRNVDPSTGRPLDVLGRPLDPNESPEEVLKVHPSNRQLFDFTCFVTVGLAEAVIPALGGRCLVDLLNAKGVDIALGLDPPQALGIVLGGTDFGSQLAGIIAAGGVPPFPTVPLVELNHDPNDGPGAGTFPAFSLSYFLTPEQQALLGCGPFYGTNCDTDGIDLFNAEGSVLVQGFPQVEPEPAVATRPVGGRAVRLPGARNPYLSDGSPNPDWNVEQDGCVGPGLFGCNANDVVDGHPPRAMDAHALVYPTGINHPRAGLPFRNELEALSFNFEELLAALGQSSPNDPDCQITDPTKCRFVRGIFDVAGVTRPEVRAGGNGSFGRRDFIWQGGAELQLSYKKRNVLGFAFDVAEDVTKTNWSVEWAWFANQPYAVVNEPQGFVERNTYNLTVSVDRPTFINFLNANRTFFFNSQVFVRYISGYDGDFAVNGPVSALGTLTVATGYHQDRLLPAVTGVYDVRSASGGVIGQFTFRYSETFSVTIGAANFFGHAQALDVPLTQALPENNGGDFRRDRRYDGLSPIAELDQVFLQLRKTF